MNITLFSLSLLSARSYYSFSPLFTIQRLSDLTLNRCSFRKSISPILFISQNVRATLKYSAIEKSLSSAIVASSTSEVFSHKELSNAKIESSKNSQKIVIYDCLITECHSKNGQGGFLLVNNSKCDVFIERIQIFECDALDGGAFCILAAKSVNIKFVKSINCFASLNGHFIFSGSKENISINNTEIAQSNSHNFTNIGDDVLFINSDKNIICHNLNISKTKSAKSGSLLIANDFIEFMFVSLFENSALNHLIKFESCSALNFEFADVVSNNIEIGSILVTNDIEMVDISLTNFGYANENISYIQFRNASVNLHFCAFDREVLMSCVNGDKNISFEEGLEFDVEVVSTHHNLWRGDDDDFSMLPPKYSETYVATVTASMVISEHQVIDNAPVPTNFFFLINIKAKTGIVWGSFFFFVGLFIIGVVVFVYFVIRNGKAKHETDSVIQAIYDPNAIDGDALLASQH
ncbi:hypothetical protein TRFO_39766 [Tritrichomonas foetus]|uniref:Right handed beta helix domain-containing protein n=1 Tax=Tritrichomonas foetus TaxID=1144522 RepID=A0A1J4J782_9EUKA|nr:hypothetical protein TRFO_39766 [Tritrichomonas foetus]|eukprot:OHS94047.1 hypothetical protein TRFO_39766 [Tritrichomonas foetus]